MRRIEQIAVAAYQSEGHEIKKIVAVDQYGCAWILHQGGSRWDSLPALPPPKDKEDVPLAR